MNLTSFSKTYIIALSSEAYGVHYRHFASRMRDIALF